ncbi:MAG: glycosyltransferase family A protein [Candidatus Paceibacterota bacterium]
MPHISVIIPAYNGSHVLPRSIGSVLAQTYADWELIVVDDGSTDGTKKVVEEFIKKDSRISYYYEENSGGPAKPKNVAFRHARGDYVAYLDQDDEWDPTKLEKQIAVFDAADEAVGLVGCDVLFARADGKIFGGYATTFTKSLFPILLLRNFVHSNSSVMLPRRVIEKVGDRDERLCYTEDWDMWIRIAAAGYRFHFIPEPLLRYYFSGSSATQKMGYHTRAQNAEIIFHKHHALYQRYHFVAMGYFRLGVMFSLARDVSRARSFFVSAIKERPLLLWAYGGYVLSFGGGFSRWLIRTMIAAYRIVHGRFYVIRMKKKWSV